MQNPITYLNNLTLPKKIAAILTIIVYVAYRNIRRKLLEDEKKVGSFKSTVKSICGGEGESEGLPPEIDSSKITYICSKVGQNEVHCLQTRQIPLPDDCETHCIVHDGEDLVETSLQLLPIVCFTDKQKSKEFAISFQTMSENNDGLKFQDFIKKGFFRHLLQKAVEMAYGIKEIFEEMWCSRDELNKIKENNLSLQRQVEELKSEREKQLELFEKRSNEKEAVHTEAQNELKNQLRELKRKLYVTDNESIQIQEQLNYEKQKFKFLDSKYNSIKEDNADLKLQIQQIKQEHLKQLKNFKDETDTEINKKEVVYMQKICEMNIKNTQLEVKLNSQNLQPIKSVERMKTVDNHKQTLLLERYNYLKENNDYLQLKMTEMEKEHKNQLELQKLRFDIAISEQEASYKNKLNQMGIHIMAELKDKLEKQKSCYVQNLENLVNYERQKYKFLEENYTSLELKNSDLLRKSKEKIVDHENKIRVLKPMQEKIINKETVIHPVSNPELNTYLKNLKGKLDNCKLKLASHV